MEHENDKETDDDVCRGDGSNECVGGDRVAIC